MSNSYLISNRTSPPPHIRRRRGRQPKPSVLTPNVIKAIKNFARVVGRPQVIEPAGFRDFRGWLSFIGGARVKPLWTPVVDAVIRDTNGDMDAIKAFKEDIVKTLVKAVVVPKPGESAKLVSTNCGRQCHRPANGVTLMTIVDKIFADLSEWDAYRKDPAIMSGTLTINPSSPSAYNVAGNHFLASHLAVASDVSSATTYPMNVEYQSRLIGAPGLYPSNHNAHIAGAFTVQSSRQSTDASASQTSLPSFEELEKSLNFVTNRHRSHSSRR